MPHVYGRGAVAVIVGWLGVVLLGLLPMADPGAAQEFVTSNPYQVEAAFLRNFAHYVTWPEGVFEDDRSPWRICILGEDPFAGVLKATLAGRTEQGRPFEVYRADSLKKLPACHMVFIGYASPERRRAALAALKGKPVLTVAEAPDFLQEGGIIRLQVGDRVQMSVNLDQARRVSLGIQTKLLEVSTEVVEKGIVHGAR